MTGGKRKLKQVFSGCVQVGITGIANLQVLSGSVGFATTGCDDESLMNACSVAEITIDDLNPCDILLGSVWGMSGCFLFNGELFAGDGQASLVYRYSGCGSSADPRAGTTGGTLRYIAFEI